MSAREVARPADGEVVRSGGAVSLGREAWAGVAEGVVGGGAAWVACEAYEGDVTTDRGVSLSDKGVVDGYGECVKTSGWNT